MEELLARYRELKDLMEKYNYACFVIDYDQVTDCPKDDRAHAGEVEEFFERKFLDLRLGDEYLSLVDRLWEGRDALDELTRMDIEIEHKELEKTRKIPKDELDRHISNLRRAGEAWQDARDTHDYSAFLPELAELIDFNRKYIKWEETDTLHGYDVLLDDMEEGYTEKMYDEFFDVIESELVPFVKEVLAQKQNYNPRLDSLRFNIPKQKELTALIAERMEYTNRVGCIRETHHPFTNWANNRDVRITTSYSEELLFSNLYSVMHEIGHALFQLQMDDKYNGTNVFNNVTCITHESQSRFYENYLGRSRAFVHYLTPVLKALYPEELNGITEEDLYRYINRAEAQFRRTEADELTYPLHVLIRYRVEQKLFHGEIDADGMEETFNHYMKEYLGIVPRDAYEGCFQDSHWSSGFGYFPTYAVGSAYGAMFYRALAQDVDVDAELSRGDFSGINQWLKEKIHRYSGTRKNLEVVRAVCGREFDVHEYVDYLKTKYRELYDLPAGEKK